MNIEIGRTYIGIVEENNDPRRMGRCRIRIVSLFDDLPIEDIPWASPWKDLNGNSINIPEVGKIVTCVFDSANQYKPEYIYADHYNINLENKLKELSDEDYKSMKALFMDHKTQIYVNDSEGLMIDYKFNNINMKEDSINVNLKDNYTRLNLGDAKADQSVILGTNFIEWLDEFIKNLIGAKGGAFLGNRGAPITPTPQLLSVCQKFFTLKDTKFLSDVVFTTSNFSVDTVSNQNRNSIPAIGDDWKSTLEITTASGQLDETQIFEPSIDDNNIANRTNDPSIVANDSMPVYVDDITDNTIISSFAKEVVRIAKTQETVVEIPKNTNRGPEVEVYQGSTTLSGTGWAWCAAFICYCFRAASQNPNINYKFTLPRTAGAFDFENWAKKNSKYVDIFKTNISDIRPGDIIVFTFSHVGIAIGSIVGNKFNTIEGNTNQAGSREGDGVYVKSRNLKSVRSVIRLKYDETQIQKIS